MATQGATLDRRGMHVPIWPIAALLVIAVATLITVISVRLVDDTPAGAPVTTVQDADGYLDGRVGHPSPRGATAANVARAEAIDAWSARIHDLPAGPFHESGRAHEVVVYTRGT